MAQYIDIDGIDKKLGSVVEVKEPDSIDEPSRTLVVDGVDFSVEDLADDISYLGELSSTYGSMALEDVADWIPAVEFEKLKSGIYNALSDIEDETTPFTVEGIVSALYSIKQLVAPDESPVIGGEPDPVEPTEEPNPEEPEEN